jgi:hypothetical protein
MKTVTSFEHACEILGRDPNALPEISMLPEKDQKAIVSHYKLTVIFEAANKINGEWTPDWTDSSQWKYYPWFNMSSGSGLSYFVYDFVFSYSTVGSRLCVGTWELAEYLGKTFIDLYTDYFILPE